MNKHDRVIVIGTDAMDVEIAWHQILIKTINNKEPIHNVLQPLQPDHPIIPHSAVEDVATQPEVIVQVAATITQPIYCDIEQDHRDKTI